MDGRKYIFYIFAQIFPFLKSNFNVIEMIQFGFLFKNLDVDLTSKEEAVVS